MAYIGQTPKTGNYRKVDDISSSFNGVLTEFSITVESASANIGNARQCLVSINGVLQEPDVDFTVGSTADSIALSSAPESGDTFWMIIIGDVLDIPGIADASVTTAKIADDAVTNSKLADNAVDTAEIVDDAVTVDKIADNAVDTSQIVDDAVTLQKIVDNAVTNSKIANNAIDFLKLATSIIASQAEAEAGTATDKLMTPERTDEAIKALNSRVLLETIEASGETTIDFDSGNIDSTYKRYEIEVTEVVGSTDNVGFGLQMSNDGGTSYETSGTDYKWSAQRITSGSTTSTLRSNTSNDRIEISNNESWGFGGGETLSADIVIYNPSSTSRTLVKFDGIGSSTTGEFVHMAGGGLRYEEEANDAIRFLLSSGNFTSGTFKLYGVL